MIEMEQQFFAVEIQSQFTFWK